MNIFGSVSLVTMLLLSLVVMASCGSSGSGGSEDSSDNIGIEQETPSDTIGNPEFEARFTLRFVASWSVATHTVNFPPDPHFSPLTGAVHSEQVVFWQSGQNASDGIEFMAETGGTELLLSEIQSAIDQGYALSSIEGSGIPLSPGETEVEFVITRDYPLLTVISMLAPSPDWFVGINSLPLLDNEGEFVESVTVELNLYDSGTDGGLRYTSADEDIPLSPVALVNSFPLDTDFLDGRPSVGMLEITKLPQ